MHKINTSRKYHLTIHTLTLNINDRPLRHFFKLLQIEYQMGARVSEFQQQFRSRYYFVQIVDDPLFGKVRIYRKNTFRYDYIMVLEINIGLLTEDKREQLEARLQRIRTCQNDATLRVYYYKFSEGNSIRCGETQVIIYAQYFNRTLKDYLAALRKCHNFNLSIEQLSYVLKNVAKGCITLKSIQQSIQDEEMGIHRLELSKNKIFVSQEGEVMVCPLLYVIQSLKGSTYEEQVYELRNTYNKYSVSTQNYRDIFPLRPQFICLFFQLSGNIRSDKLFQSNSILNYIHASPHLEHLNHSLPECVQSLSIQQMSQQQELNQPQFFTNNDNI